MLVKYTFPYNWSWVECLLFGAIFGATDPVAVVAVLKEVITFNYKTLNPIQLDWKPVDREVSSLSACLYEPVLMGLQPSAGSDSC